MTQIDRWRCIVDDCPWFFDRDLNEGHAQTPWAGSVSATVYVADRRTALEVEDELRAHLRTHDVVDFARTIGALRDELTAERAAGATAPPSMTTSSAPHGPEGPCGTHVVKPGRSRARQPASRPAQDGGR